MKICPEKPAKLTSTLNRFHDRVEAADMLATRLMEYRGKNPLVLIIPRGAAPMGKVIATKLGGELDVLLVHKLCSPGDPEFAIGAIDEAGWIYLTPYANIAGADPVYLEQEKARQLSAMKARRALYTPLNPPINPLDRIVIVVDDGLATGATMIAALHAVRDKKPGKLICAVPVAAPESLKVVTPLADRVVCLLAPDNFAAIGQFYRTFPQVSDAEVREILGSQGRCMSDARTET